MFNIIFKYDAENNIIHTIVNKLIRSKRRKDNRPLIQGFGSKLGHGYRTVFYNIFPVTISATHIKVLAINTTFSALAVRIT
ncbi:MAG: hypothetical protein I8H68_08350 [Flavobacteriia bacterium]|nr:hypothetical protein [Flavobacteriia bacterium]